MLRPRPSTVKNRVPGAGPAAADRNPPQGKSSATSRTRATTFEAPERWDSFSAVSLRVMKEKRD